MWRCRQQEDGGGGVLGCLDTMPMQGWTSLAAVQANAIVNLSLSRLLLEEDDNANACVRFFQDLAREERSCWPREGEGSRNPWRGYARRSSDAAAECRDR
jgi:hypothetical protein